MKKSLLTLLCGTALPVMTFAADMPTYCTGTAPNNSEGNHYGANNYTVKVNNEEKLSFSSTSNILDLTSSKTVDINAGDELTFNLSGGFHMQWGVAHVYIDWNGDGTFDESERYTIYENLVAGDLADYVSDGFNFTSTTPVVVPNGIHNGPVAMRFVSGEARMHNNLSYDPCTTTKRGKMVTVTANLNGTASFEVPQAADYSNLSALTFSYADGSLEGGQTTTLPFGTEITINATPEDGYEIASITVLDNPVINGGSFALTGNITKEDIDIVVGQGKYALNVMNDMAFDYTITKTTGEDVDLAQVLQGTDLKMTVDVPSGKILTGVTLGDETIHELDGAYNFTMPANNATLTLSGREKQLFTVTIEQPAEGGTIEVSGLKKTDDGFTSGTLASGDKTLEGETLTLSFNREPGYTFVKYTVNNADHNSPSLVVNQDVTISAVVEEGVEYPAMTRYFTNNLSQQNRYIKKFTTSGTDTPVVFEALTEEELPFIPYTGPINTRQEEGAVMDKTATPIVVEQGTESFTYSFDVWTGTINTTVGSESLSCGSEIDWTQLAYYVDWNRDGEFTGEGEYVTRDSESMTRGKFSNATTTKTVTIPDYVKPGVYRMRLVFNEASGTTDWTTSIWDNCELRNGVAYDFNINIVPAEFANPRTVTIASEDEALGSVAFDEYEGTSVSTTNKNVSFTATPAEGVEMLNWTNADNEVVATTASYIYKGEADASFTAHFGYRLLYSADGNGTLSAFIRESTVGNGTILAPGTEISFVATPNEDRTLQGVTVNGNRVEVDENGAFTVTMTSAMDVKAIFVDAQYTLTVNISGAGTFAAGIGYDDNGMPSSEYANGSLVGKNTDLYFAAVPNDGEQVLSITATNGGEPVEVSADTNNTFDDGLDDWRLDNGAICFYASVAGDVVVNVTFSGNSDSINGVNLDGANGAVEYFNLQGMKIEAKNLTPGMYIMRQGDKTSKVMINKD